MAMKDVTGLMSTYRECSRNLWNVYFSTKKDVGRALDAFSQIRESLFDSLVLDELPSDEEALATVGSTPTLTVVPRARSLILIQRPSAPGEASYWDEEKDLVVGPEDITLSFIGYFDFCQIPIMDFQYFRCKVLSFPSRSTYEGREALLQVTDARILCR